MGRTQAEPLPPGAADTARKVVKSPAGPGARELSAAGGRRGMRAMVVWMMHCRRSHGASAGGAAR